MFQGTFQLFIQNFRFQLSMGLDIVAHWLHCHVTLEQGKGSHKSFGPDSNPILRIYYTDRRVLFFMCAGNELFYRLGLLQGIFRIFFEDFWRTMVYSLDLILIEISAPSISTPLPSSEAWFQFWLHSRPPLQSSNPPSLSFNFAMRRGTWPRLTPSTLQKRNELSCFPGNPSSLIPSQKTPITSS